ncbi:MAG: type IV toxin-antitoxin system AbiEi family antitoxin [Gemmatimonadota bacterium]|nr:type IV toxin-antitoxin system AbiEi family antitoxin [Gemmatimonadota bacterium]
MKKPTSGKDLEITAVNLARDLLDHVLRLDASSVRHGQGLGSDDLIDGRIDFQHGDDTYALIIQVKSNGAPRFIRSAVYQLKGYLAHARQSGYEDSSRHLIPMLVSPYLSPESRSICTDHDVAYLDLVGNAHLAFDSVYIDRAVADRPKSETRALRSIFTPKSAAILRALIRDPDRAWRVADLATAANASLGHVSNVRKALLEREWIEKRDNGVILVQPDALLRTWREDYRQPDGHRISGYTFFHGEQLSQQLSGKLNPEPQHPRAIYSSNSAAQWFAPFARGGTHSFYADEPGARMLKEVLKLTHAAKGANVILRIPKDESLFEDADQPAPGIFCASPIVTYLDLWNGNDRDREVADYMASKCFPWL